jgi:hypothetical protein
VKAYLVVQVKDDPELSPTREREILATVQVGLDQDAQLLTQLFEDKGE